MAPGMAAAQMGATWSPLHAAGFHDLSPRIPQDRTLGEFSELAEILARKRAPGDGMRLALGDVS